MNSPSLQRTTFLTLLVFVTIGFFAIVVPFYGAVFWAGILALLFAPVQRHLQNRWPKRKNITALATLSLILLLVILPVTLLTASLVRQATMIYDRISSGELNLGSRARQVVDALPKWLRDRLEELDLLDLAGLQDRLTDSTAQIGRFLTEHVAPRAINIGQNTLQFAVAFALTLYLLFFLLRDGSSLAHKITRAIPLTNDQKRHLSRKLATVIKATVKGNIAVGGVQGALGGLIFWVLGIQGALLWAVLMGVLSLLPVVGASLIWGPVAIYFLATGALWQGIVLIAFGVFVIGLVDNVLRPILVGKDTKLPDYVVLLSTLGGLSIFGLNGFVIGPLIAALFVATWDLFVSPEAVQARDEAKSAAAEREPHETKQ